MDDQTNLANQNSTLTPAPPPVEAFPPISSSSSDMVAPIAPPPSSQPTTPIAEPAPSAPPAPPANASAQVTSVAPKRRGIKKILFILLFIVFLGLGAVAVVKFVLPRLSGINPLSKADIVWWGLWDDPSIVTPLIDEYQQSHPNVKITYVAQSKEDYRERLTNAMAKGEAPDIFESHNTWVPMFRNELASLPSSAMSVTEFADTFYPIMVSDLTLNSSVVGMPLGYDGLAMYVNDEILSNYGRAAPTTWNEVLSLATELTIKDQNGVVQQSGVALGTTKNIDHWPEIVALMMLQNGANLAKPNDSAGAGAGAVKFYKEFATKYGVWDNTLPPSTIAFAAGKVAIYFGPSWRSFEILDQNPALRFRVLPVPQLPKDANPNEPDITYATYWADGVWTKSKSKDAAWQFLAFVAQKESLQKLYTNAAALRRFGRPYPRMDMRDLAAQDPFVAGVVSLAGNARSWYLASRTFDGVSGINSSLAQYYEDVLNVDARGVSGTVDLETVASGVNSILVKYGLATPPPTSAK